MEKQLRKRIKDVEVEDNIQAGEGIGLGAEKAQQELCEALKSPQLLTHDLVAINSAARETLLVFIEDSLGIDALQAVLGTPINVGWHLYVSEERFTVENPHVKFFDLESLPTFIIPTKKGETI